MEVREAWDMLKDDFLAIAKMDPLEQVCEILTLRHRLARLLEADEGRLDAHVRIRNALMSAGLPASGKFPENVDAICRLVAEKTP